MRHSSVVKPILCCLLLFAAGLRADETQDRAAIAKTIAALNDPLQRPGLFTRDVDSNVDFDRLIDLHRTGVSSPAVPIGMNEPWTEMTVPRVVSGGVRFVTPDVAIVDGASTVPGAVTLAQRVPLLFVLKKEGAEWRIAVVRRLPVPPVVMQRLI
jgi:hypothetical protein